MSLEELIKTKREDILHTATKYGAFNVLIFGSVARGEADAESDIDLLVDMEPSRTHQRTRLKRGRRTMRNILIHAYYGINRDRVWSVVENDLPNLKTSVDTILNTGETTE